jgi:hypothetical protein
METAVEIAAADMSLFILLKRKVRTDFRRRLRREIIAKRRRAGKITA